MPNLRMDGPTLVTSWDDPCNEIQLLSPNLVVALGEEALIALTGEQGITKWRGSILNSTLCPGQKVIPSFTPQWIMRGNFQHLWSLVSDLSRAEKQSHFAGVNLPKWSSRLVPNLSEARQFIEAIPSDAKWSLDIETRANELACFSIAYKSGDVTYAMCFPIQNPGGAFYLPGHEASLWRLVQSLMDRNPYLIGQNITFDLEYLFDYGLEPSGIWMDTMLSHAILYPELPKGLDFLCSLYTEMPYYKSEGKVSNPKATTEILHEYNNKDTVTTLWVAEEIEKELRRRKLWQVHEFVTSEISLALEMQRNRLYVNSENKEELKVLVNTSLAEIEAKWADAPVMKKLAGEATVSRPNVRSPKQMAEFLYGDKGLKLPAKTQDGKVVSDETAISELKAKYPNIPELGWVLEERHLLKLNSSYLDIILEQDGTIGGSWCVHGTETGRWTSGKSPRGRGINLQTMPKAVR